MKMNIRFLNEEIIIPWCFQGDKCVHLAIYEKTRYSR